MYARFTAELLNFDIAGFGIPTWVILVQLAAGTLLPVAAAAFPVVRGCRIPVSAALRDYGIAAATGGTSSRLLHRGGLARPLLLALRGAFRRRQRLVLTLAALAAGGAVYLGALDLRAAIRSSVGLLFDSQRFDIALRFSRACPADSLETAIAGVSGVARAEAWGAARAALAGPAGIWGNSFPISAPPSASQSFAPKLRGGRWPGPADGNALVVNRRLLGDEPGFALGGEVTLLIAGRPTTWNVIGIADTGPSAAAYTCRETLARVTGDAQVDRAVVAAASGGATTHLDLVQRLRAELAGRGIAVQSSHLMEQSRRAMEDHLAMVAGFLGVMLQLMIVVGGLGLAATMSLAVIERTREIGVLRAVGARHRSILMLVQLEGLVIAGLSWLIALPLSVPMSAVLGHAFGRIMIPVPVSLVPEPSAVLRWLGIALAVSLAACAWPAHRATRVVTATALAYE
jgi:putative ABC transport system permease protein